MKLISIVCAALLVIAVFNLPIQYYTFLRIAVTLGALAAIFIKAKRNVSIWDITFIAISILFNPIIPIYLYNKSLWIPIDIFVAGLFLVFGFREERKN